MALSPYAEWYENSLRFPDSPVARHHREAYGDRPYAAFAADFEAGLEQWDPTPGPTRFARGRRALRRARHQAPRRLLPVADRRRRTRAGRAGTARATSSASWPRPCAARGMRFGVYYSGGLDWTFDDRADRLVAEMLAAIPRGDYPAYADAQVRELIARYRPSVLWNDIAWPADGRRLVAAVRRLLRAVPEGVVNDRWMPLGPLLDAPRARRPPRSSTRGRRQARQNAAAA